MRAILEIRPDLKAALDHLAVETHRSESDLANEAVASYLERSRLIAVRAREKRVTVGGTLSANDEIESLLHDKSNIPEIIARIKASRYKSSLDDFDLCEAVEEGRD